MLKVENLSVSFQDEIGNGAVVDNLSFSLEKGEILAIVGESGSGKSMTALSVIGLLKKTARLKGKIMLEDVNLLTLNKKERRAYMGNEITMIFQEPMTSLNPVMKVGKQAVEMLLLHKDIFPQKLSRKEMKKMVIDTFEQVDLPEPEKLYDKYPHELSGGMRQRVMIAMATLCHPKILIADEPTTALDVQTQEQIIGLLKRINQEKKISILMITHDLNVVADMADRIVVMHDGKKVEEGSTNEVLTNPKEEYTKKLIASIPKGKKVAEEQADDIIVKAEDLSIYYKEGRKKHFVIENLSFEIQKGEILGLVGRSGLGKTTISKTILGIHKHYTGTLENHAKHSQMIFQDPFSSLNPSKTIGWILEEPLKIRENLSAEERRKKVVQMLEKVGLGEEFLNRKPSALSGGQRQRVSIALSVISGADFIIADEPVSALDVTIQAQVLELLLGLQKEYGLSMLFISHDIHVIEKMCDRILRID